MASFNVSTTRTHSLTHLHPDGLVVCKAGAIELLLQRVHPLAHSDLQQKSDVMAVLVVAGTEGSTQIRGCAWSIHVRLQPEWLVAPAKRVGVISSQLSHPKPAETASCLRTASDAAITEYSSVLLL
jgi:hypothetical protein